MAEYTVTYNITANASSAITAFTELESIASKLGTAATQVNQMATAVKNFNKAIGSIQKKTTINVRIGKSVQRLESLATAATAAATAMERVVAAQGVIGGVRGGGKTAAKTSKALAASTTRAQQATTSKAPSASSSFMQNGNANTYLVTQAGRTYRSPQAAVGTATAPKVARSRVIPRNIMHRTLGPAFLSNNGGALDMIKGMGIMYGLTGVGSAFAGAVSDYMDYNNIMTTTRAILGTHDKGGNFNGRFSNMESNIRKIGMRTKYTAPQVAAASKFLAMAGLDIESINKSMPAITDIALVADSDLSETADVVTNIMTAYQMKPDRMREVADKMTMAFTMSNTTLMEMAESYKYFASIAAHEGMDFTDTTAMIGLLGDAGLKGSHAGTTIRQIFNNLKKPNKSMKKLLSDTGIKLTGDDGKLRPLFDIFSDFSKNNALDKAFEIFRVTAAQGAVSLGDSTEKWLRMREAINNSSGISSSIAETRINNLQGLWKQIQSSFEDATFDALANYEPQVMNIMKQLISWLQSSDGRNFVKELVGSIWDLVKAIGEITVVFVNLYRKFAPIINLWLKFKLAIMPIITIINVLRNLFNAGLGIAAFTRSFGKASLAVSGFVRGFTKGGLVAGASAFNATMNGVAATAERTAMRVATAGSVFATGGVSGVKTPLGYMTTGNMSPYSRVHYESQRNFYESNLMTRAQREQLGMLRQQITANNSMMNAVAASRWMPDFMKREKLGGLRTANQSLTGKIRDIYNATKPTEKAWRVAQQRRVLLNDERLRLIGSEPRKKLEELQRRFNSMKPPRSYKEREHWGRMKYKLAKMQSLYPSQQANWESAMQANQRRYEFWTNKEIERRRIYDFRLGAWNAAQQARAGAGGANQFFGGQSPTFRQRMAAIPSNIRNWWNGRKNWGTNISNWAKNNPNAVNGLMGMSSIAGGLAGGVLGGKFGNSDYSGMYWGTFGSMLPMLWSAGPIVGTIGTVAGAIGGLWMELSALSDKANEANKSLQGLANTMKTSNGFYIGEKASDEEIALNAIFNRHASINEVINARLHALDTEIEKEEYLAQLRGEKEWLDNFRGNAETQINLFKDATGSKWPNHHEMESQASQFLIDAFGENSPYNKATGYWTRWGGNTVYPAEKTGKAPGTYTTAAQSALYSQSLNAPDPKFVAETQKWEKQRKELLEKKDLQGLVELFDTTHKYFTEYYNARDKRYDIDVWNGSLNDIKDNSTFGNMEAVRQGTMERFAPMWYNSYLLPNIKDFKEAYESGVQNITPQLLTGFIQTLLSNKENSLLYGFGLSGERLQNYYNDINWNSNTHNFETKNIKNANGQWVSYRAEDAAKNFIQQYEAYSKFLDVIIQQWGLSKDLKAQALVPFNEQYYTGLYNTTDNETLKQTYAQKIFEARQQAIEQVFSPQSGWMLWDNRNENTPKYDAFSWLKKPLPSPLPLLYGIPNLNMGGYMPPYLTKNTPAIPVNTNTVNLGGVNIANLNGELSPTAIKGLGDYVQKQVEVTLVSLANSGGFGNKTT